MKSKTERSYILTNFSFSKAILQYNLTAKLQFKKKLDMFKNTTVPL